MIFMAWIIIFRELINMYIHCIYVCVAPLMQGNFCFVIFCFLFFIFRRKNLKPITTQKNFILGDSSDSNLHFYDLMLAGESQSAHRNYWKHEILRYRRHQIIKAGVRVRGFTAFKNPTHRKKIKKFTFHPFQIIFTHPHPPTKKIMNWLSIPVYFYQKSHKINNNSCTMYRFCFTCYCYIHCSVVCMFGYIYFSVRWLQALDLLAWWPVS